MGAAPFVAQAFRYAHAYFSRCGLDAQLYTEDPLTPTALPAGLREEFEQQKLAGLLTVGASFPWRHMKSDEWRAKAVPHVNLGAGAAPYSVEVDHQAFLDLALAEAKRQRRRNVVLLEREEHALGHLEFFRERCASIGLSACPLPDSMPPPGLGYEEYGYQLMHRVWAGGNRPDAAIIPDDVIAKGVSQAALALSLSTPEQFAMIAMTNRGTHFFYPRPIVAIEVDVESMVATAAGMLVDLINGVKTPPRSLRIPPVPPGGKSASRKPGKRDQHAAR
jgi:DNA-binding LacI/PurR family transcriptional regulator